MIFDPNGRSQGGESPKCSKLRDLIAIVHCDSNRESQITSDLRQHQPPQKSSMLCLDEQKVGIVILMAI